MSKEQIEKMAFDMCGNHCSNGNCATDDDACHLECVYGTCAERLYNAGYRKQREGHWVVIEYEYFTCSECGDYHPNGCDSTAEAKERLAEGRYPRHCSNCGAKMKGGEE